METGPPRERPATNSLNYGSVKCEKNEGFISYRTVNKMHRCYKDQFVLCVVKTTSFHLSVLHLTSANKCL